MAPTVCQVRTALIIFLSLTCLPFIAARFVEKEVERGILPGLAKRPYLTYRPFLVPRGLGTYKTLSQEREGNLEADLAELNRMEDELYDLWQDLGD